MKKTTFIRTIKRGECLEIITQDGIIKIALTGRTSLASLVVITDSRLEIKAKLEQRENTNGSTITN